MDKCLLGAICIEAQLLLFANIFIFFKLVKLCDSFVPSASTTQRALHELNPVVVVLCSIGNDSLSKTSCTWKIRVIIPKGDITPGTPDWSNWENSNSAFSWFGEHRIKKQTALFWVDQGPEALSFLFHPHANSLLVVVVEERAEETGVEVVKNDAEEMIVELKRVWELLHNLELKRLGYLSKV